MAYTKLTPRFTPDARVEEIDEIGRGSAYRLSIPSGKADKYRFAQLDDYTQTSRGRFPHRFGLTVSLLARASSDAIPGTWGFGLWDDPFGMSLGFGGNPFRLPALPNAVWFFGASKESYLSFKEPLRPERSEAQTKGGLPTKSSSQTTIFTENHASTAGFANFAQPSAQREAANGFLAQTFRSPKFHPLLIFAGLALPFSRKLTRRLLGRVIEEDGIDLCSRRSLTPTSEKNMNVDPTQWHRYKLDWSPKRTSFEVDDALVFESLVSPNPPLGLVIWIDNQYASFTPDGKIGFGVLANPEPVWLEIKDLKLESQSSL